MRRLAIDDFRLTMTIGKSLRPLFRHCREACFAGSATDDWSAALSLYVLVPMFHSHPVTAVCRLHTPSSIGQSQIVNRKSIQFQHCRIHLRLNDEEARPAGGLLGGQRIPCGLERGRGAMGRQPRQPEGVSGLVGAVAVALQVGALLARARPAGCAWRRR